MFKKVLLQGYNQLRVNFMQLTLLFTSLIKNGLFIKQDGDWLVSLRKLHSTNSLCQKDARLLCELVENFLEKISNCFDVAGKLKQSAEQRTSPNGMVLRHSRRGLTLQPEIVILVALFLLTYQDLFTFCANICLKCPFTIT